MRKYFGDCSSYEDFAGLFYDRKDQLPTEENIVAVDLEDDFYSSSMRIFYKKDGKVFEDAMSHCSCNGYEEYLPVGGTEITKEYVNAMKDSTYRPKSYFEELSKTLLAAFDNEGQTIL